MFRLPELLWLWLWWVVLVKKEKLCPVETVRCQIFCVFWFVFCLCVLWFVFWGLNFELCVLIKKEKLCPAESVWLWLIVWCALSHYRQLWGNQNCNCPPHKQYRNTVGNNTEIQSTNTHKYRTAPIREVRSPNKPDSLSTQAQSHSNIIVCSRESMTKESDINMPTICKL